MPLGNLDCSVCYERYSRQERVPRRLNCRHAFCTPCLDHLAQWKDLICTLRCPLCRWTTCLPPLKSPEEALWVDINLWDCIPDFQLEEDEEEETVEEEEPRSECVLPKPSECLRNTPNLLDKLRGCFFPRNRTPAVHHEPLFKIFKNVLPLARRKCSATCQQD